MRAPAEDDLFQPSLQDEPPPVADPRRLPWRLGSQFVVAFFGGSIAIGAIAYLNSKRLGLPVSRQRLILAVSAAAFVLSLVLVVTFALQKPDREARTLLRRVPQIVSVVQYVALAGLQRSADRRHSMFDGRYASLWGPGFLALLASTAVTFVLISGALAFFTWRAMS